MLDTLTTMPCLQNARKLASEEPLQCLYILFFLLWFSWLSKCLKWCFLFMLFISVTIFCHGMI